MDNQVLIEIEQLQANPYQPRQTEDAQAVQEIAANILSVWADDQQNISLVLDKYICREKQGVWVKVERNDRPVEIFASQMPWIVNGFQLAQREEMA